MDLNAIREDIEMAKRSPEMARHVALDHGPELIAAIERVDRVNPDCGCPCCIEWGLGIVRALYGGEQ